MRKIRKAIKWKVGQGQFYDLRAKNEIWYKNKIT